jgi:hypothetical protein
MINKSCASSCCQKWSIGLTCVRACQTSVLVRIVLVRVRYGNVFVNKISLTRGMSNNSQIQDAA